MLCPATKIVLINALTKNCIKKDRFVDLESLQDWLYEFRSFTMISYLHTNIASPLFFYHYIGYNIHISQYL